MMQTQRSRGVTLVGYALIGVGLLEMALIANAHWYWHVWQAYPPQVILLRYISSWLLRIGMLAAGIGLLGLYEPCRKLAILICGLIIATIYWRHPYLIVQKHVQYYQLNVHDINLVLSVLGIPRVTETTLIWASVMGMSLFNVIIAIGIIFFLTRLPVKRQFY